MLSLLCRQESERSRQHGSLGLPGCAAGGMRQAMYFTSCSMKTMRFILARKTEMLSALYIHKALHFTKPGDRVTGSGTWRNVQHHTVHALIAQDHRAAESYNGRSQCKAGQRHMAAKSLVIHLTRPLTEGELSRLRLLSLGHE